MNILIASDSYKGSLSSLQVAEKNQRRNPQGLSGCSSTVHRSCGRWGRYGGGCHFQSGGKRCTAEVTGPDGKKILAYYGILNEQKAVIEMAAASGLPLVEKERGMSWKRPHMEQVS